MEDENKNDVQRVDMLIAALSDQLPTYTFSNAFHAFEYIRLGLEIRQMERGLTDNDIIGE